MARRISLGCGLLAACLCACAQKVVLQDQQTASEGGTMTTGDGGIITGSDGSSSDARCFGSQPQPVAFKAQSPEVIVALDRSLAMNGDLSKALTALVAEVQSYQNVVRFGFIDFPDGLAECANSCCVSALTPPPALASQMNFTAFQSAAYACNSYSPGTNALACPTASQRPTEVALQSCASYYQSDPQSSGRYVLLVTNGPPGGNCGDAKLDCADAESAVHTLSGFSVQTVTVDLDDHSSDSSCLHDFAYAQGTDGPPYIYSSTTSSIDDDLKTIIGTMAADACHLVLAMAPENPNLVSITYDNRSIAPDTGNGWSFDPGSTVGITLNGSACQAFIANRGPIGLQVSYGCAPGHGGGQQAP